MIHKHDFSEYKSKNIYYIHLKLSMNVTKTVPMCYGDKHIFSKILHVKTSPSKTKKCLKLL